MKGGDVVLKWDSGEVRNVNLMGCIIGAVIVDGDGNLTRPHFHDIVLGGGTMTDTEAARLTRWLGRVIGLRCAAGKHF